VSVETRFGAPVIPGLPFTREMVIWARCRPPADRPPLPAPGDEVWFRADAHGPLVPATVLEILIGNQQDLSVWRYVVHDPAAGPVLDGEGRPLMELVDDPWPDVVLRVGASRHATKEARIAGSPGWLPMRGA